MSGSTPAAAELRSRVLAAIEREPAPSRPVRSKWRALTIGMGFALAALLALAKVALEHASRSAIPADTGRLAWHVVTEGSDPVHGHPLGYVVTLEAVWVAVAIAATWAGISRGRSMLGRSKASKVAVATLTPLALAATWLGVALAWLPAVLPLAWIEAMDDAPDVHFHTNCAMMSVAYAVGPLLAFFAIRRSRDPVSPRHAGAAIGAVAGAWGAVVHFPFCQCTSPLHMAFGHVLPVAVLAAVGALVGEPLLGMRADGAVVSGGPSGGPLRA